jgi:PEP-CTERM motif
VKPPPWYGDKLPQFHRIPAKRSVRWKRTLLLAPVLVGLFFVAVAEHSGLAINKMSAAGIIAALKDPLTLFAERSPGGRGSGALLPTKSKPGPHERVLSAVREREPPLGIPSGVDNPVFTVTPGGLATSNALPGDDPLPGDQVAGSPSSAPRFPLAKFGDPERLAPAPTTLPNPGISAVPEPASWVMMILGFFAIGVAVRRRVRQQTDLTCVQ